MLLKNILEKNLQQIFKNSVIYSPFAGLFFIFKIMLK
jgi:hypothetical protein